MASVTGNLQQSFTLLFTGFSRKREGQCCLQSQELWWGIETLWWGH